MMSTAEGYGVRDLDTDRGYRLTLRQAEINRKTLFNISIIRPMRRLMILEGAKFKRNRKKHRN